MSRNAPEAAEGLAVENGPDPEKNGVKGGEPPRDPNIVDFDGPNDPEHPLNWSTTRKTITIVIVSLTALLSPIGSTISAAAAADIMHHFNTTNATLGALMTTIYLLGYAFGPLLIAPLSELHGRAPVFRACAALFALFNAACALAPSLGALIAFRLLAGIAGSCAGTLGASAIADMVPRERRGRVMSAYIMGPTLGPTIGPIIGGNLTAAAGWRWDFWVMAIAAGVMAVCVLLFLHESYPYAILKRKTARLRKSTGNEDLRSALDTSKTPGQLFKFAILRPPKMLVAPIIFLMSAYAATVFSYAYLCFTTFPRIFKDQYGFGSGASGLTSIGIGVGFILGLLFVGAVSDPWSAYLTKKNDGVAKPEFRLPTLVIGAVFVPIGLFWYGWSAEFKAHWIVPIMGTALLGIGIVTAYTTTATYLIDAYTVYSASVMAASAILRCLFGALLPLAGSAMFDALGVGWGNSVLGFISLAFLPLPFILFFYGERIRESKLFKMQF
ncbi:MFS transporter fsa7 [Colletotrichum gloeosporioides]|uniref:MFS transporter fsa7 n=1 Tax=Colletotrichum gloeosporioides TaxID=474922 RepID=A0A8H4CTA0_COLGL|nr:MFS transporter fsa7 [Colletotrichum gloeosporioides]KAF3809416.1 MFS transporter fsa7 [Colletotrichum gloeosporioides]